MKKLILFTLLSIGVLAGTINVAVAANVSYAIEDLKTEFNRLNPDTKLRITLGSSGKLTAQISNGAPYDIFMAANMKYPNALYKNSYAVTKPVIYAQGSLAYLSGKQQNFSKGADLLKSKEIKRIAIANPKTAPYGKASIQAMKNASVYDDVKEKLVFAETVSQTVTYAITAADVGFIAKSSLYSPKMREYKENIHWNEVDPKLFTPINQGVVLLKQAKNNQEAKNFYDFILSKRAQKILKEYGYLIP